MASDRHPAVAEAHAWGILDPFKIATDDEECQHTEGARHDRLRSLHRSVRTHTWSSELFSDRALRALNISTTTSTVMATVEGCLSLKMAHISSVSQCLNFMSSDHVSLGPVCPMHSTSCHTQPRNRRACHCIHVGATSTAWECLPAYYSCHTYHCSRMNAAADQRRRCANATVFTLGEHCHLIRK